MDPVRGAARREQRHRAQRSGPASPHAGHRRHRPLLSSANSLTSVSSGTVRLIGGPPGRMLLAAYGIRTLICAGSLSYLLAATAVFLTSRPGRGHANRKTAIGQIARDFISPGTALPAAAAIGMSGSMSLVIPQTTLQRLIPDAMPGRVSAIFLTGEAAATLAGAVAGPFLAQAAGLQAVAAAASLLTPSAAALARLTGKPGAGPVLQGGVARPGRRAGRCCSMHWPMMLSGAPPQDAAK